MKDFNDAPLWHQHRIPGVLSQFTATANISGLGGEQKQGRLIISAQIIWCTGGSEIYSFLFSTNSHSIYESATNIKNLWNNTWKCYSDLCVITASSFCIYKPMIQRVMTTHIEQINKSCFTTLKRSGANILESDTLETWVVLVAEEGDIQGYNG